MKTWYDNNWPTRCPGTEGLVVWLGCLLLVSGCAHAPSDEEDGSSSDASQAKSSSSQTSSSSSSSTSKSSDRQTRTETQVKAPELRDELLKMMRRDQKIRESLAERAVPGESSSMPDELIAEMRHTSRKHAERLESIVESRGRWPGRSLVGQRGAQAAFLVAQHADFDPELQAFFLKHLERAVEQGEASPRNYAYLVDRVRIAKGKKQLYGTQLVVEEGRVEPKGSIVRRNELDRRRQRMGLAPFDEYLKRFEDKHGLESSDAQK
jgi:hypothetical protein